MAKKTFTSKVGLIMAAAGGAVGLGNIWKFPYVAGQNGGAAFLLVYLGCVVVFGMPLLMNEFLIGKKSGKSAFGAFRELSGNGKWQWLGWISLITAVVIMGFYFVVTGWCLNYLVEALTNRLTGLGNEALTAHFALFSHNAPRMMAFALLAVALTAAVLWFGVNKGIERLSKILMPLLLVMMLLMAGRVLMLDGCDVGMRFLFQADFSKITPQTILVAMGQSFFSLSIGMGALITYGSYMPKNQNVMATSMQVIILDTLVAVMAGIIIFPAVFAFGFNPAEGPELAFVVLPAVFNQMYNPWLSSVLFFGLLCIAAVTSTISLMEVVVAFVGEASEKTAHPLGRHKSVALSAAIVAVMVILCVLSMSGAVPTLTFFGYTLFDLYDMLTSCILMPLGAVGMAVFTGWFMPGNKLFHSSKPARVYLAILRWIIPVAVLAIFLNMLGII